MKTPLLYSIVPIAPSKTMMRSGSRRRSRRDIRLSPHRVILRLRMMHDDGRRALLRDELERAGQLHSELALGGQELEHLRVVIQIRTRAIAPRVALSAPCGHTQIVPQLAVCPFGDCFGGLHRETVSVVRLGVFAGLL